VKDTNEKKEKRTKRKKGKRAAGKRTTGAFDILYKSSNDFSCVFFLAFLSLLRFSPPAKVHFFFFFLSSSLTIWFLPFSRWS